MASVAFLGTGLLGGAMVEGMLRRGDRGHGLEPDRGQGARARGVWRQSGGDAGDAVAGADRVHMTLPDDEVVDRIVAAFTPRLGQGRDRHRPHDDVAARHQGAGRAR